MICPNCHTENRSNAKFCDECGYELPTVAPEAREMFDDDAARTGRLGEDFTVDLQGFDQMNDSSYAPDPSYTTGFIAPPGQTAPYMPSAQGQTFYRGEDISPDAAKKGRISPRNIKAAAIVILCIAAIVAAIVGITYSMQMWGGKIVPDVVGMSSQDAKSALESEGFSVEIELVKSDEPADIVLSTDPASGSRVDEGSTVALQVSAARVIPNVLGMTLEEAKQALLDEGFTNIEVEEVKSNESQDTVLEVNPQAGTRSTADAHIVIQAAVPFRVPDVRGKPQDEAAKMLEEEGYSVKIDYVYSEDVEEGLAVGTDPAAGSALNSGSEVTLNLAKSRASELESLTRAFLNDAGKVSIDGRSYEISEISSVRYAGDDTCTYTMIARPYETHSWFGLETETRYGNYETIDGSISWNDANEISSSKPKIEKK